MEGEFTQNVTQYAHLFLEWIGFGTIVGLLAKAIMPGRDPGGAVATLAMGVGGTIIGCGIVSYFYEGYPISPISWQGLLVGTAGSFIILFFYRLLGGYWFIEGERPTHQARRRGGRRRRRYSAAAYDSFDE